MIMLSLLDLYFCFAQIQVRLTIRNWNWIWLVQNITLSQHLSHSSSWSKPQWNCIRLSHVCSSGVTFNSINWFSVFPVILKPSPHSWISLSTKHKNRTSLPCRPLQLGLNHLQVTSTIWWKWLGTAVNNYWTLNTTSERIKGLRELERVHEAMFILLCKNRTWLWCWSSERVESHFTTALHQLLLRFLSLSKTEQKTCVYLYGIGCWGGSSGAEVPTVFWSTTAGRETRVREHVCMPDYKTCARQNSSDCQVLLNRFFFLFFSVDTSLFEHLKTMDLSVWR